MSLKEIFLNKCINQGVEQVCSIVASDTLFSSFLLYAVFDVMIWVVVHCLPIVACIYVYQKRYLEIMSSKAIMRKYKGIIAPGKVKVHWLVLSIPVGVFFLNVTLPILCLIGELYLPSETVWTFYFDLARLVYGDELFVMLSRFSTIIAGQ